MDTPRPDATRPPGALGGLARRVPADEAVRVVAPPRRIRGAESADLGGLALGPGQVTVDQGAGEVPFPSREFDSVRLERVAAGVALTQRLPLCNEASHCFL